MLVDEIEAWGSLKGERRIISENMLPHTSFL